MKKVTPRALASFNFSAGFHSLSVGDKLLLMSFDTLSQFFFVEQKTKQLCCGATSATRVLIPSGSFFRLSKDKAGSERACDIRFSCIR